MSDPTDNPGSSSAPLPPRRGGLVNRGTRTRTTGPGPSTSRRAPAVSRSKHESPIGWECTVCGELQIAWVARIPVDAPPYEAARLIQCRQARCGTLYWAHIPAPWREWAEVWRPYQVLLDGLWSPGNGPEPTRPPLDQRPPPLYPRIARRSMSAQFCYFMLGPNQEVAGYIESIEVKTTDRPWPGAQEPIASIMLFWPPSEDIQARLLSQVPALRKMHNESPLQPGEEVQIHNVRRGMDPGNFWPLGQQIVTPEHEALAAALHAPDPGHVRPVEG